jgi:hypothetical protein
VTVIIITSARPQLGGMGAAGARRCQPWCIIVVAASLLGAAAGACTPTWGNGTTCLAVGGAGVERIRAASRATCAAVCANKTVSGCCEWNPTGDSVGAMSDAVQIRAYNKNVKKPLTAYFRIRGGGPRGLLEMKWEDGYGECALAPPMRARRCAFSPSLPLRATGPASPFCCQGAGCQSGRRLEDEIADSAEDESEPAPEEDEEGDLSEAAMAEYDDEEHEEEGSDTATRSSRRQLHSRSYYYARRRSYYARRRTYYSRRRSRPPPPPPGCPNWGGGWGPVCRDYFDTNAARLACAAMGFATFVPGATAPRTRASYSYGPIPRDLSQVSYATDDLRCSGSSSSALGFSCELYGTRYPYTHSCSRNTGGYSASVLQHLTASAN